MSNYLGGATLIAGLVGLGYWGNAVHAPRMEAAIRDGAADVAVTAVHPLDVRVSGRDVRVRGYVDDEAARDRLLAAFRAIDGRRAVVDDLIVLPRADPFEFNARKAGDEVVIEGHAPSQAARSAIAEQTGAGAGNVSLASGAPLGWTQSVQVALDALAQLNGGALQMSGTGLRLTGTAQTPAEKSAALAILAGLPDGIATDADIDIRDDGTLPYEITYDAGEGVTASGHLPKGLSAEAIAALMGVRAVAGADMQSEVGSDRIDDVLSQLAGWLPEMDLLRLSGGAGGIAVDVALLPGTDAALVGDALSDLGADAIVVRRTDRQVTEGARRTNAASGLDEVFSGGFWLPEMRFEATVATCTQKARAALSGHEVSFLTGTARLGPRSTRAINALAAVIRTCTQKAGLRAELGGHTDNSGDAGDNVALSLRRAEVVLEALVARGVPRTSLRAQGYGASRPIASNATEDGRAKNRRITVRWSQ